MQNIQKVERVADTGQKEGGKQRKRKERESNERGQEVGLNRNRSRH